MYFLRVRLSGIIAITNSNRENASPWNITVLIFTTAYVFPPVVGSIFHVFIASGKKFMTSSDTLCILR